MLNVEDRPNFGMFRKSLWRENVFPFPLVFPLVFPFADVQYKTYKE